LYREGSALTCRPGHPARHEPFEPGHLLALKHGAYSPRLVGERAELVRSDLLAALPGLTEDPESTLPVALYCRAVAREELAHEGLEAAVASGKPISPRLLEAASAAARVARELGDGLGVGPRASAELSQIRAETALSLAQLAQQAPAVLAALNRALAVCGLAERAQEVVAALGAALTEVSEDV
jgi:hypothetical protein